MKLTRIQKYSIAVFIVSLAPAFWIANWRYDSKLASLNDMFDKEQALHLSTDKLLGNCEKNAAAKANPYDATYQICNQGSHIHEHTEQAMTLLANERAGNETEWYRNFALTALLFNFLAFILYSVSGFLKREADQ
jgi:hypothetical protein